MVAKEAVLCPKCGALNRPSWEYCARCNESLQGAQHFDVAEGGLQTEESRPSPLAHWVALLGLVALLAGGAWAWRTIATSPPPARPDPGVFTMGTQPVELPSPQPQTAPGFAEYIEARRRASTGDIPGALDRFAAAVSAAPDNAEYHAAYAYMLWRSGDRERSLSERAEAARLDPRLQMEYARLLEMAGRPDEAVREYEAVLARNPGAAVVHGDMGRLFFRAGDYAKAANHLRFAVESQPEDPVLQQELAYSLDQTGSREQAEAVYRKVLAQVPRATMTRALLAGNLYDRGRRDEAVELLQQGVRVTPDSPGLQRSLGDLLSQAGRNAEAAAAYREYLRLAPNAPDARSVAARLARAGAAGSAGASTP